MRTLPRQNKSKFRRDEQMEKKKKKTIWLCMILDKFTFFKLSFSRTNPINFMILYLIIVLKMRSDTYIYTYTL